MRNWHPQHPKASSVSCSELLQCSLGDACPVVLFLALRELLLLLQPLQVSILHIRFIRPGKRRGFLADFVRGGIMKDNWGKRRHFRDGMWELSKLWEMPTSKWWSQSSEIWGSQKQAANAEELQVDAELSSNPEKCLLFGFPMVSFWEVWSS